ncbi:MAG: cyclic nucleotide-binding domain-containing protein [Myxococcota bacterium]|jgi:CRP-like cAMP-binding protein
MELTLRDRLQRMGMFATALAEPGALELLLGLLKPREFKGGTVILAEDDEGTEMYILHRGRVRIRKRTPLGDMYTVVLLDEGSDDAFFGEVALLESERRSATVEAETDAECFVMTKDDFIRLGDTHPRVGLLITREIAKILSQRMRKANHDMVTLFTALVSEIEGEMGCSSTQM